MSARMTLRWAAVVGLAAVVGCGSDGGSEASSSAPRVRGYVLSSFGYASPEHEGDPCPGGFNRGAIDMRLAGEDPIPDDCFDPEANSDPGFKTLSGPGRLAGGVDIDGVASTLAAPAPGECRHEDFTGAAGETGVDHQLWRAIGCVRGFQPGEIADIVVNAAVRDGSMTILLEVLDVDGDRDDNDVGVQVFASTDAPPTAANGDVLPFGTLSAHADAAYHSSVGRGAMVDGVTTAGPMDVRIRLNIQIVETDLTIHDAVVRMETRPDGTVSGAIAGYQPIQEFYDIFAVKTLGLAADALSFTCSGLWAALKSQADGDFDPATGACSSISVAYRFEAAPAFIVR